MAAASASAAAALTLVLAGCQSVPPGRAPVIQMPAAWTIEAPWRDAQPLDAAAKGPWWQRFDDPLLDTLEQQALAASPTLAAAEARLAQARAQVAGAAAGRYPQIGLGSRAARQRISANRPLSSYASTNFATVQNDLTATLTVSYELDLADRVGQVIAGASAAAEQSAADLENTRLLLSADLATNYFNLRSLDRELDVLRQAIALQRRALGFVGDRHDLGAASGLEVAQQQALLDNTLAQVDVLRRQRAQFEHALATLVGTPAPGFVVAALATPSTATRPLPEVPLGVPSDVLQRRPDVASAERAMAVANAQIGVANAAFFPSITLGSGYGAESRALSRLFDAPSVVWSLGASAAQVLFDGGRLRANAEAARAGHAIAAANYRRVVLTAMQEVEDGISGVAALARAAAQADTAVASARRVLALASGRYEGGASTYLDVITAQQALLSSERQATQLRGQQQLASVYLIKALGGGW